MSDPIRVLSIPDDDRRKHDNEQRPAVPAHWANAHGTKFVNPWPSFREQGLRESITLLPHMLTHAPALPDSPNAGVPVRTPTWGLPPASTSAAATHQPEDPAADRIKATWLGHACFLLELPAPRSELAQAPRAARGARILFDPVFSARCSPVQWAGPARYSDPPCRIEDIPDVDVVVISHNHYDHLDTHTIGALAARPRPPHIFAPRGNARYFASLGIPPARTHTLDWWDARRVVVDVPASPSVPTLAGAEGASRTEKEAEKETEAEKAPRRERAAQTARAAFDLTCTPAQHFSGRGVCDRARTLWASWAVEEVRPPAPGASASGAASASESPTPTPAATNADSRTDSATDSAARAPVKVFFAGDTGYRTVRDGEDEAAVPTCPAFREIGARFGGFDFAMVPIGAYRPRSFMSPIHCAPQDSVRLFRDVRAKRALGMHWGTWVLTTEDVHEPPRRLAEECARAGVPEGVFGVCDVGETRFF